MAFIGKENKDLKELQRLEKGIAEIDIEKIRLMGKGRDWGKRIGDTLF